MALSLNAGRWAAQALYLLAAAWGLAAEPAPRDAYLQRLADALAHDDAYKVRLQAAVLLGRTGDGRAVEPLLGALAQDQDATVRAAAALALGNLADGRAVAALVERQASDPDAFVREQAATALGAWPRARALPYVIAAYGSDDPAVRRIVLRYVDGQPVAAIEPVLVRALGDLPDLAELAGGMLVHAGDEALRLLTLAVNHRDPAVRRGALQVLARLDRAAALPLVLEVFDRDTEVDEVREAARRAVFALGKFLPVAPLVEASRQGDQHARARALKRLGALGGAAARQALLEALHADDIYVRGVAVLALGDLADPSTIVALQRLQDDPQNARIAHLLQHTLKLLEASHDHPDP